MKTIEEQLVPIAWKAREYAVARKTKVGCAIAATNGLIYSGCNIEHDLCNSLHAEVVAISKMVSNGCLSFEAIVIVAEMEQFTPCGGCMDWLLQFCEENALVGVQNKKDGSVVWWKIEQMMPHYPKKYAKLP